MRAALVLAAVLATTEAVAASLEVRVVDARTGAALAGAKVDVELATKTTDADGVAVFEEPPLGPDVLFVEAPDYVAQRRALTAANLERPLVVALVPNRDFRRDLSLRGAATWEDGGPMPGEVQVRCGVTERYAGVDDAGAFELEHLAPGRCQLRFHGAWRGVNHEQYFTLDRKTPPLVIGPRTASVPVSARVLGAGPKTELFLVAGDAWSPPRSCWIRNDGTGGVSTAWGDPGARCERAGDRFTCPSVPAGWYTLIARTTLRASAVDWEFHQWSLRLKVGDTAVSATLPAFTLAGADAGQTGRLGCQWP